MTNYLIKGGTIVDGSGAEAFRGDLRIRGADIAQLAPGLEPAQDEEVIPAEGLVVSPGFIDAHCHSDTYAADCRDACGKILQGVTTDVSGLCGTSSAPIGTGNLDLLRGHWEFKLPGAPPVALCTFAQYRAAMNGDGLSANMALFVGNTNLRVHSIGYRNVRATAAQMDTMKGMLRESMEAGAYGLSTGLTYTPSMFSDTEELIELSRVIAPYGGIYNSHMRNESDRVLDSIREVIEITEKSGCIGHISHLKASGLRNHGKSAQCLELIHEANRRGVPVTFDVYPYTAGSCSLRTLLPPELLERGAESDDAALRSPETRRLLESRLLEGDWDNLLMSCGPEGVVIASLPGCGGQYEGKSVGEISARMGEDVPGTLLRLLRCGKGQGTIIYYALCEEDLTAFMRDEYCTIGTDAFARNYTGPTAAGKPHPRNYGSFPRFIRKYILEEGLFSMEAGIAKISGLTARQFHIPRRGILKPGNAADVTVFDPREIREAGTFDTPALQPPGIEHVFVAGRHAVQNGKFTGITAGRVL